MSTEKTDGVSIRLTDFSETSRVVVFFTRDFGKISVMAKGARRLKGPFESALDLLSACRIVFIRKSTSGLDILTEAQLISAFRPPSRDLSSLYGGYYIAELLLGLTEEYDPHPLLYDAVMAALKSLMDGQSAQLAIIRFELLLLREIGHLPSFDICVGCGAAVTEGRRFGFWVSQGGLICEECQKEEYSQLQIQAGTAALLRRLSGTADGALQRLVPSSQQIREMKHVTTAAVSHLLGRKPKTLRYLQF